MSVPPRWAVQESDRTNSRGFPRPRRGDAADSSYTIRVRMVRFLTAGESHGRALVVILEGIPAGLSIDLDSVTRDLRRRQGGYGRGRRMAIESDRADIISGVRAGETIGGPIAMLIENRDWVNWQQTMFTGPAPEPEARGAKRAPVTKPRPGHADLAGIAKYGRADIRDILSGRAHAKPRRGSPPRRSRVSCSWPQGSASPATCSRSAKSGCLAPSPSPSIRRRRCPTILRCAASMRRRLPG